MKEQISIFSLTRINKHLHEPDTIVSTEEYKDEKLRASRNF